METVELEGLSYDPDLRDKTSGFYVVLTATLKEKVWPEDTNVNVHKLLVISKQ